MKRLLLLCVVAMLTLSGCASGEAAPSDAHGEAASGEAAGPVVLPEDFPSSAEVPLFDGTLLNVAHSGNIWAVWVESTDLAADLATATALLVDAGYEVTTSADAYADLSNATRKVRIIASVDETWGSSLAYTFTDGAAGPTDAPAETATPEAPAEH
ncbi:MAG: hypothetical protein KF761_03825 [Salinibacterium sp.]|nr:hypothetical protein [Salinibacterium sp.]